MGRDPLIIIDPTPAGWRYGFPKALPDDVEDTPGAIEEWVKREGYPASLCNPLRYSRWSRSQKDMALDK